MHDPYVLIGNCGPFELWHRDRNGIDGACGWFMRAEHGDKAVFEAIVSRYRFEWQRSVKLHDGTTSQLGLFDNSPFGWPVMSIHAIALNLFFWAAFEHFNRDREKAVQFMRRELFDILLFAENPSDSAHTGWLHRYGIDERETQEQRIDASARMIYGWVLRASRPWYRHPRWHVHHWRFRWRTPRLWRRLQARRAA